MDKNRYAELIGCKTPEEVTRNVRKWSSSLSEQEHLIRSTILEIHANIEMNIKKIFYEHMKNIISYDGKDDAKKEMDLNKAIDKLSFMTLYRILKPCFASFPVNEFKDIPKINEVRNRAAHSNTDKVLYKTRNPFKNFDCLAQLFFDSWAIVKGLNKFFERMIDDPRALQKMYADFYYDTKRERR